MPKIWQTTPCSAIVGCASRNVLTGYGLRTIIATCWNLCYFIASGPGLGVLCFCLFNLEETRSYFVHSNLNGNVAGCVVRRSCRSKVPFVQPIASVTTILLGRKSEKPYFGTLCLWEIAYDEQPRPSARASGGGSGDVEGVRPDEKTPKQGTADLTSHTSGKPSRFGVFKEKIAARR